MADERELAVRAQLADRMAKTIKRMGYTERQVVQVLRVTPDKAKAIMEGRLDEFTADQIRKMISVLD